MSNLQPLHVDPEEIADIRRAMGRDLCNASLLATPAGKDRARLSAIAAALGVLMYHLEGGAKAQSAPVAPPADLGRAKAILDDYQQDIVRHALSQDHAATRILLDHLNWYIERKQATY
jgi:hypothetical protein